jgi:hypothetical protein
MEEFIGVVLLIGVPLLLRALIPRRQYGRKSTTKFGLVVRSRAEQRIADYFDSIGLAFEYEKEIEAGFWIFKSKVSKPDFYLPDYDVYVEYWGLLNVENSYDRSRYTKLMKYKMARYHQLGIKFISIYPENMANLDWIFRRKFEKITGQKLPNLSGL